MNGSIHTLVLSTWLLVAVASAMPGAEAAEKHVSKTSVSAKSLAPESSIGTTIIGEKEAPVGLYLMPWKNAVRDPDMDRPPLLHDEQFTKVDGATFHQQVQDRSAIATHQHDSYNQYH